MPKDGGKGQLCTRFSALHHFRIGNSTGQADIVQNIDAGYDQRSRDKRAGQVLFGVLQLRVDARCNNPALVGKRGCDHSGEQRVALMDVGIDHGFKILNGHSVDQTHDQPYHRHQ